MYTLQFGHHNFPNFFEIKLKEALQSLLGWNDIAFTAWPNPHTWSTKSIEVLFVWMDENAPEPDFYRQLQQEHLSCWIGVSPHAQHALHIWKSGAADLLLWPLDPTDLLHTLQKCLQRVRCHRHQSNDAMQIGIRSYGDHRYFPANDIIYLKADSNSTDIHLLHETITAFKTLKHFEQSLPFPHFVRIHNSYIVNVHHIKRIQTGHSLCYVGPQRVKIPFSKSYKSHIDFIIRQFSQGNYLEL